MLNKFKITSILLSVAFLSAGCGGSKAAEDVTLQFWKPFEDSQHMDVLIRAYEEKHPNVRVEYTTTSNIDDYGSEVLNALASGNGPDIFSINNSWLPKYLDKITPAPEKQFLFRDYKDAFVDTVVNDFTKDGKIYGTALSVDTLGLYYNKDLLFSAGIGTPPKTWDELARVVRNPKITRSNSRGYFTQSGLAAGLSANVNRAVDIVYLMMLQAGVVPWSEDGLNPTFSQGVERNGNYTNPGSQALEFYTSFANPQSPNYTWNASSDYSIDAFASGRAVFLYSYAYTRATLEQKAPSLNFDVAPVPQPDLNQPAVNFANYWGEVVNKQSKHADWAWDFLKFISSKEALDAYYAEHKQPSSRKDLISLQTSDPEIGVFAYANLTAKPFYKPDQKKLDAIMATMVENVVLRGVSVDEALGQAENQAATLTRRY